MSHWGVVEGDEGGEVKIKEKEEEEEEEEEEKRPTGKTRTQKTQRAVDGSTDREL